MTISDYLIPFASIVALAWAATEGVAKFVPWRKDLVAIVIGVVLGEVFHGAGFLPDFNQGWWDWLLAALVGACASVGAGAFNDYIVKAIFPKKA